MTKKEVTQLSFEVVNSAIRVHKELGPGLLENVYQECMEYDLERRWFQIESQKIIPISFEGLNTSSILRVDLFVENTIVVELKSVDHLLQVHTAQLLTYMRLLKAPQGLLINFYVDKITNGYKPYVNNFFNELPD